MEDLKAFSKGQGASEANDLSNWDINFWSERLRESKYDINEVESHSLTVCVFQPHSFVKTCLLYDLLILYSLDLGLFNVGCHFVCMQNQYVSELL